MHKFTLSLGLAILAAANTPAQDTTETKNSLVTTPALNSESAAQVGEVLLHQGEYYQREVIHLSQEIRIGKDNAYTLTPGYYLRSGGDSEWGYYVEAKGDGAGKVLKAPGVVTLQEAFQVSGDGKTVGVVTNYYQAVRGPARGITRSKEPALSSQGTQRAIVYGGKEGSKILLGYKEIWMAIQRPSEIQFVELEVGKSKVVEFHGARIEIIKATGDSLRYRVLQSFDTAQP